MARLPAKGYSQSYGIDCFETFSYVVNFNIVRILIVLAKKIWLGYSPIRCEECILALRVGRGFIHVSSSWISIE